MTAGESLNQINLSTFDASLIYIPPLGMYAIDSSRHMRVEGACRERIQPSFSHISHSCRVAPATQV